MKKNLVHTALSLFVLIVFATSAYPQWVPTNWPAGNGFFALYTSKERVFARTWDGLNGGRLLLTTDFGANWTQIGSAESDMDILSIVMVNGDLLAGTWNGLYRSTTAGTSWDAVTPAGIPADTPLWSLAMVNAILFAGARGAVYRSSDNGATWTATTSGIPANARITTMVANGDAIFAGSDSNGVFITTNGGTGWTAVNSGLADKHISQLVASGTKLFVVTLKNVFVSDNNGASWAAYSSSIRNINSLLVVNDLFYAGTDSSGVCLSVDGGITWTSVCSGMPASTRVWSLAATSNDVFAATNAGIWRAPVNPVENSIFTITASASSGGTIAPQGDITVYEGCSHTFAITPATGYRISDVLVDGASAGAVASYAFTNVMSNHTISATFAAAPFTITASAGSGGSIFPAGTVTVAAGSSQTFSITPSAGYEIGSVLVDGVSVGAVPSFTFSSLSANHTISASFSSPVKYQINCGGSASSPFTADQYYSGGTVYSVTSAISTTGVNSPAPPSVYQSERYGAMTYTLPNLATGAPYTVRLHFAELYQTATGKRRFNVAINGTTVLSNYDIYAVTGARYKAVVREFTATANGSGQIVIGFTNVTDNAKIDGIEIIRQNTTPNSAPTIATVAAATPGTVTGTTTVLSVLGADDNGESNLTYAWATTGTPPAAVTFGANGTNAAKNTTATFTRAGSYSLQVVVKDAGGLTAVSSVSVTVNQILTSIVVTPTSATMNTSSTQQFTATARDQFTTNLTTQPSFTWSVSGGGIISSSGLFTAGTTAGTATVSATSSGVSGTAGVTITAPSTTAYQINCGGSASSPFTADQYYSGGTVYSVTSAIITTGVNNPAPPSVYQTERYGTSTYTLPGLTAGASYTVRLHFAELYWTATGKRTFNVAINGTTVLSNYDIYAETGARYKAVVKEYTATANSSGQIVIKFTTVTDNAKIGGIQVVRQ